MCDLQYYWVGEQGRGLEQSGGDADGRDGALDDGREERDQGAECVHFGKGL